MEVDEVGEEFPIQDVEALYAMNKTDQLTLLRREMAYILEEGLELSEKWFEERAPIVYAYMTVNWAAVSERFENKDSYLHQTANKILELLAELEDQLGTLVYFNIEVYANLLDEIYNILMYYMQTYVGDLNGDADMVDLTESMSFL